MITNNIAIFFIVLSFGLGWFFGYWSGLHIQMEELME